MEIHQYLDKKKKLQYDLLRYIENERNVEENFSNLIPLINDQNIHQDPQELQAFLYLLIKITNNFNRSPTFFRKIEKIILYVKNDILNHLTNYEIFNIFKSNKRILLFLFQEKILIPDKSITISLQQKKFKKFNYIKFLYPELNTKIIKIDVLDKQNFDEKRKIGENDDYICELIRNDSIDEFISLVKKKRFHIKMIIEPSIFETNNFLLKNQPNLIEYSAFFGSIQIFKYLHMNGIELKPSIWIYAIHGRNPEMINYIEERQIKPESNSFFECIKESIKCHHNEIVNYIQNNLFEINNGFFELGVKYYNYEFFIDEFINNDNDIDIETIFYQFCRYNYIYLVKFLLKTKEIKINKKINNVFLIQFLNGILVKYFLNNTALMIAAKKENIDIVNLLLKEKGIDIDNGTFKNCVSLTKISIPFHITKIGENTFNGCSFLTKIKMPNSLKIIEKNAFKGCILLKQIILPSCLIEIGENAFKGCSSLTQILITYLVTQEKINEIKEKLKKERNLIKKTSIGNNAFKNCTSLNHFLISSQLASIGKSSFEFCSSLKNVSIYSDITTIRESAFKSCSLLNSVLILSSETEIGSMAFVGCKSLKKILIPFEVTSIGDSAFEDCVNLRQITIIDKKESLNDGELMKNKFDGNDDDLSIQSSDNSIEDHSNLNQIKMIEKEESLNDDELMKQKYDNGDDDDFSIQSTENSIENNSNLNQITKTEKEELLNDDELVIMKNKSDNNDEDPSIPFSTELIVNHSNLNQITEKETSNDESSPPEKVLNDDNLSTMKDESNDSSIFSIQSSFQSIENNPTVNHSNLNDQTITTKEALITELSLNKETTFVIPSSVKSIGNNSFENCSNMINIKIPSSVLSIGSFAFRGCSNLKEITIPSSVKEIGDNAFYECFSLTKISMSSSISKIRTFCFRDCKSLNFVSIPTSVTEIGYCAFYGCTSLKKILIPSSVTEIGYFTFCKCTSLTEIKIPSSVASIGGSCFEGCSSLKHITIPPSVISIGENVLKDCNQLQTVEIPAYIKHVSEIGIVDKVNVVKL